MNKDNLGLGTGKRKTSIARVYLRKGSGDIVVNNRRFEDYFLREDHKIIATQPLESLKVRNKFDILVNVFGGGISSQAAAIRLGIARALLKIDEKNKEVLRKHGYLTRDARIVERKKYGKKGARRSFQFSKR